MDISDIDFLFLDAEHTYDSVSEELDYYKSRLSRMAYICVHDAQPNNETWQAVKESNASALFLRSLNGLAFMQGGHFET